MTQLVDLPESIFRSFSDFVSNDDYRCFMNASKEYFTVVKRQTIYFSLNAEMSSKYLMSDHFQQLLLSKVENGWKQIRVNFPFDIPAVPSNLPLHKIVSKLGSIGDHRLVGLNVEIVHGVQEVRQVPKIPQIRGLKLYRCKELQDLSNLSHLSSLSIIHGQIVREIKPLENIEELWLEGCPMVKDYSMLNGSKQKTLYLKTCPNLTNVMNFAGIRNLTLSCCDNLEDVSPLRGIYDLSLLECSKVRDIRGLGDHYRLRLRFLHENLLGYESLLHIPHVSLACCDISDLQVLQYAKTVNLWSCNHFTDVRPLKKAEVVVLERCYGVANLSELGNIPELHLTAWDLKKSEATKLKNKSLVLREVQGSHFKVLTNIRHLTVYSMKTFTRAMNERKSQNFQHLQSLRIEACEKLTHVNGLGDIPLIKVISCKALTDISGLGRNREVEITKCDALINVSSLATVPIVTIVCCKNVYDLTSLANVPRLKVIKQ